MNGMSKMLLLGFHASFLNDLNRENGWVYMIDE